MKFSTEFSTMAYKMSSTLFSFILLSTVLSAEFVFYGPNSDVTILSPSNFKETINEDSVVLVKFFASWSGHCKYLAPIWEKVAKTLKGVATIAAVDYAKHESISQEYGIQGFPTIMAFVPGKKSPIEFNGVRDVNGIVEFALQQVKGLVNARLIEIVESKGSESKGSEASASVELSNANFEDQVVQSSEIWLVGFFAPWCGHCKRLAPEWKRASNNLKGKVKLGHVDCTQEHSLCSKYDVSGFPTILLFEADKESPSPLKGARTASAIEDIVIESLESNVPAPEIHELTDSEVLAEHCVNAPICFVAFLPHILDTGASGRNTYLATIKRVAHKFKKDLYKYVWTAAGLHPELEKALGVGGYGYPALIAVNVKKQVYAPLKSPFQVDHIWEFIMNLRTTGSNVPLELTGCGCMGWSGMGWSGWRAISGGGI